MRLIAVYPAINLFLMIYNMWKSLIINLWVNNEINRDINKTCLALRYWVFEGHSSESVKLCSFYGQAYGWGHFLVL